MKRLNKILSAVQKFASKDYNVRYVNGIKFDMVRQTIEATDGHGAIIIKGSRGFIAGMANDYAEYLGLEPVGDDFSIVKLAPKNGKPFPRAERLPEEANHTGDLWRCIRPGEHDPQMCNTVHVLKDQFPRMHQLCGALKTKLKLIPGTRKTSPMMQYGKSSYNGNEIYFCIVQMPALGERFDQDGNPLTVKVSYSSLDEIDKESMAQFASK